MLAQKMRRWKYRKTARVGSDKVRNTNTGIESKTQEMRRKSSSNILDAK